MAPLPVRLALDGLAGYQQHRNLPLAISLDRHGADLDSVPFRAERGDLLYWASGLYRTADCRASVFGGLATTRIHRLCAWHPANGARLICPGRYALYHA